MLTLRSPAKINLFLRVKDKRLDGYHNLDTLIQTVDLCDTLYVSLAKEDYITCTNHLAPTDDSNLISKATKLFRVKTGIEDKLHVHLVKRIPIEAGLGGGSSNAATTLWAFNELCGKPATLQQLMQWGAELGSDVPFFFSEGTAFCMGRGEIVQRLPAFTEQKIWIVKPHFGSSTAEVYRNFSPSSVHFPSESLYFNDLEPIAFSLKPQLAKLKNELLAMGFATVVMSGSGSSFFCIGQISSLSIPHTFCYNVAYINRKSSCWY